VLSVAKLFLKVNCAPPAGTAMVGLTNWSSAMLFRLGAKASLGALKGLVAEVTQRVAATPVAVVVQPAGSAGATTPSKFWENAVAVVRTPSVNVYVAFPRSVAPSWS
jgi:hypothetical protein